MQSPVKQNNNSTFLQAFINYSYFVCCLFFLLFFQRQLNSDCIHIPGKQKLLVKISTWQKCVVNFFYEINLWLDFFNNVEKKTVFASRKYSNISDRIEAYANILDAFLISLNCISHAQRAGSHCVPTAKQKVRKEKNH